MPCCFDILCYFKKRHSKLKVNIYIVYMKVKKHFYLNLLKTFRRKSSTVKIYCSDIHFFDILQVYYNKIVVM